MMAAFYKDGAKPVLVVEGPHDSAKTSSLVILTSALDPYAAQLPSLHKSEENLFIYARNRVFAGFDNVSDFKANISDALCQIATGGSITKRKNYTDDEEFIIPARSLLALNGISTGLKRPDLLDRTIKLEFQPLSRPHRTMQELLQSFAEIHPRMLGGVLRAVQYGLQHPTPLPTGMETGRLADFAQWTYQWAPAMGLNPDKVIAAICKNQKGSQAEAICTDTCADFIFSLLDENDDEWSGTATDLFKELNNWINDDWRGGTPRKGQFPAAPNTLHDWLKRSAPLLETAGVNYEKSRDSGKRMITITRTPQAN